MKSVSNLRVTSHVGRDLLASAAAFRTEAAVAWEYVANSLQYVDRGVSPIVNVRVTRKEIVVADNGAGMDANGLQHFFTMHAENKDRRLGRPGRGKWGTGKSAAFGIANTLRVDTTRGGLRNVVELTRAAVEKSTGAEITLNWVTRNEDSSRPGGTIVYVSDLNVRAESAPIIEYVERHLAFFRGLNPSVAINTHVCEYHEPSLAAVHRFRPTPAQAGLLGDIELIVKVAKAPLKEFQQGIAVTAGPGNLLALERAGVEAKEFGSYLFGEVDVPALEAPSPIAPYDSTRNLTLNPRHPIVAQLLGFIGGRLEEVRHQLVDDHRKERQTEQARRLRKESQLIAQILNTDFSDLNRKLREIRSAAAAPGAAGATFGDGDSGSDEPGLWVAGIDEPGTLPSPDSSSRTGKGKGGHEAPDLVRVGEPGPEGLDPLSPRGGDGAQRRPRGGFKVDFDHLGADEDRSTFDRESMTIIINLDHPLVTAALGDGEIESLAFRRLAYEIAISEYSIALGYRMAEYDSDIPADDLLFEVRKTLHRVARSAAALYK
jgi:hypothetical protein